MTSLFYTTTSLFFYYDVTNPLYYDVTKPLYYDVTTMTSLIPFYDVIIPSYDVTSHTMAETAAVADTLSVPRELKEFLVHQLGKPPL